MPTHKVADVPLAYGCSHPDHNIPTNPFPPGVYLHECPNCHEISYFRVGRIPTSRQTVHPHSDGTFCAWREIPTTSRRPWWKRSGASTSPPS